MAEQDVAPAVVGQILGDPAQNPFLQPAVAVGACNDQIGADGLGGAFDFGGDGRAGMGHGTGRGLDAVPAEPGADQSHIAFALGALRRRAHFNQIDLFGIGQDQIIECDLTARYKFRNLIVVQPGDPLRPTVETTRYLAGAMRSPPPAAGLTRRFFLVRSTPTRTITNMDEVASLLAAYNFEYLDLADADIKKQRAEIGEADIVVCTYGSDLLAALFMQAGSDMIELKYGSDTVSPDSLKCCTDPMFSMLDVNFHIITGRILTGPKIARMKKDQDFTVNCGELRTLLDNIIARKAAGKLYHDAIDVRTEPA